MPSSTSAMRVAQTGTPRTKLWVPSIGSTTHWRGLEPVGRELLADDGVARSGALELDADELLGLPVGVADEGEVGLGLDPQVLGAEACRGDPLDGVGEHVGEAQVVVIAGHGPQPSGAGPTEESSVRRRSGPLRSQSGLGRHLMTSVAAELMVFHGHAPPEGAAVRGAPRPGADSRTRPPDQRVVTPLHVGGHPCEEPLARSRSRPCPPPPCSPQVAAAAAATTPRPRQPQARRAATSPSRAATPRTRWSPAPPRRPVAATSSTRSSPSSSTTTPTPRRRERHRRVHRHDRQPELHRQAQQGLQVPRRHRGQGQELRRRLELRRLRAPMPRAAATSWARSRATPTSSAAVRATTRAPVRATPRPTS